MDAKTSVLTFSAVVWFGIWGWSAWQILQGTKLVTGARFVYAFGSFPVVAVLFGATFVAGMVYAPSVLDWLVSVSNIRLPFHLEALVIVAVALPVPIVGFLIWTKAISKLERRLINAAER